MVFMNMESLGNDPSVMDSFEVVRIVLETKCKTVADITFGNVQLYN